MADDKNPFDVDLPKKSSNPFDVDIPFKEKKNPIQNDSKSGGKPSLSGFNPIPSSPQSKTPSIFTPKGKDEYQEQVKAFKPQEVAKEGQPKPAKKVDGGVATAFMKGLNDFNVGAFKAPRLIYDAASSITDTALQALNITETDSNYDDLLASAGYQSPLSILDRIGDYYTGQSNKYEARQEKFSKGIIESFNVGEYKNSGKQLLNNIAGSIPSMVGMAVTGGAGNIGKLGYVQKTLVNALPFVSQKNVELSEDESIPKSVRVVNSILNGLSEVIFDQSFGTQSMIQKIGQVFANEGKEQAVKVAKDFTKGFVTEAIKKIQPFTGTIKGAVEEMSTRSSQNIVDKYTVNPDKELMEGVLDAGLVGGTMTGGIGALGTVALSSSQKKKAGDLMKQREELVDDLDNNNLSEEVKDNLVDKLQRIDNDLSKIDDDGEIISSQLSEKDKAIVSEKEQKISSIEQALQDESISETSKEILADTLIKEQDAIDEILSKSVEGKEVDSEAKIAKEVQEANAKFAEDNELVTYEQKMKELDSRAQNLPKSEEGKTIIEELNTIQDAIQEQTAGQVPVLTEATVGEEVEQGKPETKPQGVAEEGVQEEVKPIKQLGTGANVYFETDKHRVNDDLKNGKVLLNVGSKESETPMANIEFDNAAEAVAVAKELDRIYPKGVPDAALIDRVVEDIRKEIKKSEQSLKETSKAGKEEVVSIKKDVESTAKALEEKYGITLDLSEDKSGDLSIGRIIVPKENRSKGVGKKAMQDIVDYADKNGRRILLTPSTDFGATSVTRLKEFYKEFGFIENKGKNKDFTVKDSMYRNPQLKQEQIPAQQVEQLRADEQAEYAAMSDPKDKAKRQEIHDRYDKLITPLLSKTEAKTNGKETETQVSKNIRPEPTTGSDTAEQAKVTAKEKEVAKLEQEYDKAQKALAKNLSENQQGMFENKPQSMFDDRAEQSKIVKTKKEALDKAKSELKDLKEKEQRELDKVNQVEMDLAEKTKEKPVFSNPQEATRYAIENSNDPDEIASLYFQEETPEPDYKVEGIMEYMGGKGKINERDWRRYNDINNLSPEIRKRFIDKDNKEIPLDTSAQELSNKLGVPVSEEDFIDAIIDFNSQKDYSEAKKSPNQREAERKYKELTGKNLTAKRAEDAFFRVNNKPKTNKELYRENQDLQEIGITYEDIERYNEFSQQESDGVEKIDRSKDNDAGASGQARGESESVQGTKSDTLEKPTFKLTFASAQELVNTKDPIGNKVQSALDKLKEVAEKVRALKIDTKGKSFDVTLGLPVAVWNGAVETVASAIEAGVATVDAIKRGLNYIQKNYRGQWNKKAYNDRVIEELGLRGIEVNGQDLIVKPLEDKATVALVNGFYSPLEKGIAEAKTDKATGKGWAKILSGVTEKDELVYTGVGEFLEKNADRAISKKELSDFMANNRIEVSEVVLGELSDSDKERRDKLLDKLDKLGVEQTMAILNNDKDLIKEIEGKEKALHEELKPLIANTNTELTKFSQYQLEGEKEGYAEKLITLPNRSVDISKFVDDNADYIIEAYKKSGKLEVIC